MGGWLETISQPLSAAGKTIEKLMQARDLLKFGDTFRELYSQILAAQRGAIEANARETALIEQIGALEKAMTRFERWDAEAEKYEMNKSRLGVVTYAFKKTSDSTEPDHELCPDCYQDRFKSILQVIVRQPGRATVLVCQHCGWEGYTEGFWLPEHGGKPRRR